MREEEMKGVKKEDMIFVEKTVDERRTKLSINPLLHSLARHFVLFVSYPLVPSNFKMDFFLYKKN